MFALTLFLLCIFNALAQNVTVSGTIVDESDLPLIGFGVMQTGGKAGKQKKSEQKNFRFLLIISFLSLFL